MEWITVIGQVVALVILLVQWYLEKKRQSPENKRTKWEYELYKKRQIQRHRKMADGDVDGLASDLDDTLNELDFLLRERKD